MPTDPTDLDDLDRLCLDHADAEHQRLHGAHVADHLRCRVCRVIAELRAARELLRRAYDEVDSPDLAREIRAHLDKYTGGNSAAGQPRETS